VLVEPDDNTGDKEEGELPSRSTDIWEDNLAVTLLRGEMIPDGTSEADIRRARRRVGNYYYESGVLYRNRTTKHTHPRQVPPPHQRAQLLRDLHEEQGHMGQGKVYSMLSQRFYWVGMSGDVKRHIAACSACKARKVEFKQPPTLHPIPVAQAFTRWHVDFMGPYPKSEAGNSYVMLMVCPLTNWPEAEALPDKSSASAAGALLRCISRFGCPRVVVTDQGREFEGEFGELLSSLHIEHRRSSAYHPQGNGRAERMVQTVLNGLRKALAESDAPSNTWDTRLSEVLLAYRASKHNSTGFSPALLTYGRELLLPAQLAAEAAARSDEPLLPHPAQPQQEIIDLCESDDSVLVDQARQSHLHQITTTLETATPTAVLNIDAAQQKQVRAYQSRRGHLPNPADSMPAGSFVKIKVPTGNKLELGWEGPYRLVEYNKNGTAAVLEDAAGSQWTRHVSLLAPYNV
jgi:hypothetical protein